MKKAAKKLLTDIFTRQAAKILTKYNVKLVVVAGSVGKTSTKLAIAEVLSKTFRVQYEAGNYNVPLSAPFVVIGQRLPNLYNLFGWSRAWRVGQKLLKKGFNYDVVVLEYGIDHVGEMAQFAALGQADIAVVTAIEAEHMEYFKKVDTVAREELEIAKFSKQLVINKDHISGQYVSNYIGPETNLITLGSTNNNDYNYQTSRTKSGQLNVKLSQKDGTVLIDTVTTMVGRHSINSLALAAVVANLLAIDSQKIASAISNYKSPAGRMKLLAGINDSTLIDDTYNASPVAVIAALDCLYEISGAKKIALLGNMNELGKYSEVAHQSVGEYCQKDKLDLVVTLGPDANQYLAPAARAKGCRVVCCNSPVEAASVIKNELADAGNIVLLKGSQNRVFAEEATKLLLLNRPKDESQLVRQTASWLAIKKAQFPDID